MKYLNNKILILIIFVSLGFFYTYSNYFGVKKNQNSNLNIEEENATNSNIIKDIKYSSKDLKGNEYIILANEGEIDLENSDIIFLKNVKAFINLIKKNETITVVSDYGKYNTVNYDTIFSQNVKIKYQENTIISDYLDFSMKKNLLIISKNVVYTSPDNILKADVVELDTITKNTKIFMYDTRNKVNIKSLN